MKNFMSEEEKERSEKPLSEFANYNEDRRTEVEKIAERAEMRSDLIDQGYNEKTVKQIMEEHETDQTATIDDDDDYLTPSEGPSRQLSEHDEAMELIVRKRERELALELEEGGEYDHGYNTDPDPDDDDAIYAEQVDTPEELMQKLEEDHGITPGSQEWDSVYLKADDIAEQKGYSLQGDYRPYDQAADYVREKMELIEKNPSMQKEFNREMDRLRPQSGRQREEEREIDQWERMKTPEGVVEGGDPDTVIQFARNNYPDLMGTPEGHEAVKNVSQYLIDNGLPANEWGTYLEALETLDTSNEIAQIAHARGKRVEYDGESKMAVLDSIGKIASYGPGNP